jgi:hypothetical protein
MEKTNAAGGGTTGEARGTGAATAAARDTGVDFNYKEVGTEEARSCLDNMSKGEIVDLLIKTPGVVFYRHRESGEAALGWRGIAPDFDRSPV